MLCAVLARDRRRRSLLAAAALIAAAVLITLLLATRADGQVTARRTDTAAGLGSRRLTLPVLAPGPTVQSLTVAAEDAEVLPTT
jgi:hypothetical protein